MAQLAIKGHATRWEEIIEILKMLGGENYSGYIGSTEMMCYYIDKGHIECDKDDEVPFPVHIFTIEDFLEKFPYKIGDRVRVADYESEVRIDSMSWDGREIQYQVFTDETEWYSAEELNKYNEINKKETMEKEISGAIIDRFICLEGFEFYDDKGNIINTKEITMKKTPKYPKTYKECLKILGYNVGHTIPMNHGHYGLLMMKIQRLLICRDAYWKIAGEQMGLGKHWKPNWNNDLSKYYISFYNNEVDKGVINYSNKILAFPTEEMRDAFYENFKELIEECKELL